jgi:hypothetical protein
MDAHAAILASFGGPFRAISARALAMAGHIGNNPCMTSVFSTVVLLSSAYQAASMTSRARRPIPSS